MSIYTVHEPPPKANEDVAPDPERFVVRARRILFLGVPARRRYGCCWNRLWLVLVMLSCRYGDRDPGRRSGLLGVHLACGEIHAVGIPDRRILVGCEAGDACGAGALRPARLDQRRPRGRRRPIRRSAERRFFECLGRAAMRS